MSDESIFGMKTFMGLKLKGSFDENPEKKGFMEKLDEIVTFDQKLNFSSLADPDDDFISEPQWAAQQLPLILAKEEQKMKRIDHQQIIQTISETDGEFQHPFNAICDYAAADPVIKITSDLLVNNEVVEMPTIIKSMAIIKHLRPYADIFLNNEKKKICIHAEGGTHYFVPKGQFIINKSSPFFELDGHGIKSKEIHSLIWGVRASDVPNIPNCDRVDIDKYDFSTTKRFVLMLCSREETDISGCTRSDSKIALNGVSLGEFSAQIRNGENATSYKSTYYLGGDNFHGRSSRMQQLFEQSGIKTHYTTFSDLARVVMTSDYFFRCREYITLCFYASHPLSQRYGIQDSLIKKMYPSKQNLTTLRVAYSKRIRPICQKCGKGHLSSNCKWNFTKSTANFLNGVHFQYRYGPNGADKLSLLTSDNWSEFVSWSEYDGKLIEQNDLLQEFADYTGSTATVLSIVEVPIYVKVELFPKWDKWTQFAIIGKTSVKSELAKLLNESPQNDEQTSNSNVPTTALSTAMRAPPTTPSKSTPTINFTSTPTTNSTPISSTSSSSSKSKTVISSTSPISIPRTPSYLRPNVPRISGVKHPLFPRSPSTPKPANNTSSNCLFSNSNIKHLNVSKMNVNYGAPPSKKRRIGDSLDEVYNQYINHNQSEEDSDLPDVMEVDSNYKPLRKLKSKRKRNSNAKSCKTDQHRNLRRYDDKDGDKSKERRSYATAHYAGGCHFQHE